MFRFKSLELMNWDCYPHYQIPMDGDIILLIGQNGSGKTTFLDSLRVLMNSSKLSKSRTLHHYVQKDVEVAMIRGVVTNTQVGGRRPFAHMGIHGDVDVSIICLIRNKGPKKLEKEYFIVKGIPSTEEICLMKGGIKPVQYSKYLEEAGVSRSTLQLIALEQGQTDRIGQLNAQELLQLVMDITGNKDIIKRYEEARQNYKRSSQQLLELKIEYNKIAQQIQDLEREANQAQNFKSLLDEKNVIEREKLPLARWYGILNQLHNLEKTQSELQEKHLHCEKRAKIVRVEQEKIKAKRVLVEKDQEEAKQRQRQQERELAQLHQKIGQCHSEWEQLNSLRKSCEEISTVSPEDLQNRLDESRALYFQTKNELTKVTEQLKKWKDELESLEDNKLPTYPTEIYLFREILEEEGIDHVLLAECIEIKDRQWQLAIEAHLARDRFTVFVHEDDFLTAKQQGERNRYGFYITPFDDRPIHEDIIENSIFDNIEILDKRIQGRLRHLNSVVLVETVQEGHEYDTSEYITITKQGYRQDRRGGIYIARNVRFYCGGLAAEQQREEIEKSIQKEVKNVPELQIQMSDYLKKVKSLELQLRQVNKKEQWEASKGRYDELDVEGKRLLEVSNKLSEERQKLVDEVDLLTKTLNQNFAEYQQQEVEYNKIQGELRQISEARQDIEQKVIKLKWQRQELEKLIPEEKHQDCDPDKIEQPEWLERKVKDLQMQIDNFIGCKEVEKISLFEHESKQLLTKKKQLERQEDDQTQRYDELEKCREDYKHMISDTIGFYNRAVKDLASLAGCRMRVFLELGRDESLIENARMEVRVAFDQKKEVDIRDKSLSGGQDVIASLILLVALSRMEQDQASGFFIMDEHNAHLDMLRIMEVGNFLRSTRAQFVLTTPTTENAATLAVADLIITFTKKDSKNPHAPKPRFIRRM